MIAYLQSLGGTPSVTLQTEVPGQGESPQPTPGAAAGGAGAAAAGAGPVLDGPGVFTAYMCNTCHAIDAPTALVGPSLFDVGSRMSKAEIYEAIMEPDAVIADGYAGGVMPATLGATGFYDKVSSAELKALVDYLAARGGN